MKKFFLNVLSTIVGVLIAGIMLMMIFFINVIVLVSSSSKNTSTTVIEDNSILTIRLNGTIQEHASTDFMALITGNNSSTMGLDVLTKAIDEAADNSKIKGIYLEGGVLDADPATLQELRLHLQDFRSKGKWIIAYADQYMQGAYYLATTADKLYLNPSGMIDWHGCASQPQYLKDFLAKFGIRMNVVKVGTYKSYTETYTEDHMSDANREQVTAYINGIWSQMKQDVSKSRKISEQQLDAYADSICALQSAKTLLSRKMVDGLLYADEVRTKVKEKLGLKAKEHICQVTPDELANSATQKNSSSDAIAVYYCEGGIVMSEVTGAFEGGTSIVATDVCADLEKLSNDDDIKAVVIRINSGGGDAYASEQLWHYISMIKKHKPVVVSMGGAAASGGYYMSCNASWIVAEPTTLTGSIGIFGAFPDVSSLLNDKLGLHFDEVKTNRNSTFSPLGLARPLNSEEIEYLQANINRGYELFCKRVADGRKMTREQVEKIAQGRVWVGTDAKRIGLVDQLGDLRTAIKKAGELAKIKSYSITYPQDKEEDIFKSIFNLTDRKSYLDEQMRLVLGVYYEPFKLINTIQQQSPIQARSEIMLNIK